MFELLAPILAAIVVFLVLFVILAIVSYAGVCFRQGYVLLRVGNVWKALPKLVFATVVTELGMAVARATHYFIWIVLVFGGCLLVGTFGYILVPPLFPGSKDIDDLTDSD